MVGQWTMTKPSRSDDVLDADQQLQITNQIRAQFDSMVPKRPGKPSRSESDTTPTPTSSLSNVEQNNIPELDKLRSLQSQSPVCYLLSTLFFCMLVSLTVTGEIYI
ncbi:MATERNAL EFFECT EMBRYO ARREST PROTEIN [Salix purpurea]|uniref:MATERNAL EFFECT EMBRYO ARREST PROTEIN n=1 Tax=Salix purpurea TaxID=77065 RepID=A0A9Q0V1H0_SALPP|nr:MATERNAL EFFECT EMBRYO ARREST PROTEIN [Salix purpurea]